MRQFPGGIYGILPSALSLQDMLAKAEAAMRGGLRLIQYRNKKQGFHRARKEAQALRALCDNYDCTLIVNDSIQLAKACLADGVHLGRADISSLESLRQTLGEHMLLGVTCRADAAWARHVLTCDVDYLSFGAVYASRSKPEVPVMGIPRLHKARQMFPDARICAIGGITAERLPEVRACGADAAAVISGLFSADDIATQARLLVKQWNAPAAA